MNSGQKVQGKSFLLSGLAVVGVKEQKAMIFHLSTLNFTEFEPACKLISEYLTNNSLVKEVLCGLRHYNQPDADGNDKLEMSKELKESMKQLGFKWAQMDNNADGTRATVFRYKAGARERDSSYERDRQIRLNTAQLLIAKINFKYFTLVSDNHVTSKEARRGIHHLTKTIHHLMPHMESYQPSEPSTETWTIRLSLSLLPTR